MDFNLEIDTGQLHEVLTRLPQAMKARLVRNAVAAGARVIKKEAKRLAPYNPQRQTGTHLRDAIVVQRVRSTNDVHVIGVKRFGNRIAPHAHLLEFGTVKMRPHPFLRPAAENKKDEVLGKILNNLSSGILRESNRLAGRARRRVR